MDKESENIYTMPNIKTTPKKDKKLSLRITDELHTQLESVAKANNVSTNSIISILLEDALDGVREEYMRATFIRGIEKTKLADLILRIEKLLPGRHRQFTNALRHYSEDKAPARSAWEIEGHWLRIAKEMGLDTTGADEAHQHKMVMSIIDQIALEADSKGATE